LDVNGKKPKTEKTRKEIQKNTLYTLKIRGIAFKHKKKDIKQFFSATKPKSVRLCPKVKGIAYVGFNTEKEMKQALNKNKSFMGNFNHANFFVTLIHTIFLDGKRILVTMHSLPKSGNEEETQQKWSKQEESLKNEETIAESGCIFVRNLSYTTSETDIEPLFSEFGNLH